MGDLRERLDGLRAMVDDLRNRVDACARQDAEDRASARAERYEPHGSWDALYARVLDRTHLIGPSTAPARTDSEIQEKSRVENIKDGRRGIAASADVYGYVYVTWDDGKKSMVKTATLRLIRNDAAPSDYVGPKDPADVERLLSQRKKDEERDDAGESVADLKRKSDEAEAAFDKSLKEWQAIQRAFKSSKSQKNREEYVRIAAEFDQKAERARNAFERWASRARAEERLGNRKTTQSREPEQGSLF
jgi:hypothetical protein